MVSTFFLNYRTNNGCHAILNPFCSVLSGWINKKDELCAYVTQSDSPAALMRKKARTCLYPDLDAAIYDWFVCTRAAKKPVLGPIILAQIEKMSAENQGWLRRFKERHGIWEFKMNGEASSADVAATTEFLLTYREIAADYNDDQIYNCDESGLYHRNMPDRTLAQENEVHKSVGFKALKDRVTLLLTCNRFWSHKMKPLLIGKYGKPRFFHHMNMEKLPITYRHSGNAWMTATLFEEWFVKDFVPCARKHLWRLGHEEKAILLLENCPAHPGPEILVSKDKKNQSCVPAEKHHLKDPAPRPRDHRKPEAALPLSTHQEDASRWEGSRGLPQGHHRQGCPLHSCWRLGCCEANDH